MSEADPSPRYARFDCAGDDAGVLEQAVEAAREAVESGECIVLPTDTVYGIGADAFSILAVTRLLNAKDRGRDMPPPVLIADASLIRALAVDVPPAASDLIERHWPGPLTVICRAQPSLRMDLGDTDGTIALRVPDHELARDILRRTGPMAVSSANLSGRPAASTCDEAIEQLGESVAVYLDAGPLHSSGAPSTIVDFTRNPDGSLLRRGALSVSVLRETSPHLVDPFDTAGAEQSAALAPEAERFSTPAPEAATEPAPQPAATVEPYLTTDDLGITHQLIDPDQPSLFDGAEGFAEVPRGSESREPPAEPESSGG